MRNQIAIIIGMFISVTAFSQSYNFDSKVVWSTSKGHYLTEGHFENLKVFSEILANRKWNNNEIDILKKEIKLAFIKNPVETLQLTKEIDLRIDHWIQMEIISEDDYSRSELFIPELAVIKKDAGTRFIGTIISKYYPDFNLQNNDCIVFY
ncbi:MAG TPA: hypothetical protein PLU49_13200 [Saprospiraceae bacterium]|nr:hypothetical protein [Saprospirales bacterium]HRQ31032.1 hypothetical protein [Saprospiraceae bacterium]